MATKLKIQSFVSHKDHITLRDIRHFSEACHTQSQHQHPGLPVGFQNGSVCIAVLTGAGIDQDAADFASTASPLKAYATTHIPVVHDLTSGKTHYFTRKPFIGFLYWGFLQNYINRTFHPEAAGTLPL